MVQAYKTNFNRIPSDEDLKLEAKSFIEEYKLFKEKEMENVLGEDADDKTLEISESNSSDDENNENESQDESNEEADDGASDKSNFSN